MWELDTKFFEDKEILITGGTGTLGKQLVKLICKNLKPRGIRIYSRDELKQWELRKSLDYDTPIAFMLGDIRDKERLRIATRKVDIIINTAALKQIGACEFNPIEAINTNVMAVQNLIDMSIENGVDRLMHISTDKAVYPVNLYGCTKAVAEKAFTHGNVYTGGRKPFFSCCRYGNVLGSRGSIIPLFKKQYEQTGTVTITDHRMTRFWISVKDVARFVLFALSRMEGGEIFVPKMPSSKVLDIAKAIAPNAGIKIIGIRPGEKLHECLITKEESVYTEAKDFHYVIQSPIFRESTVGKKYWSYDSKSNLWELTKQNIMELEEMQDG